MYSVRQIEKAQKSDPLRAYELKNLAVFGLLGIRHGDRHGMGVNDQATVNPDSVEKISM